MYVFRADHLVLDRQLVSPPGAAFSLQHCLAAYSLLCRFEATWASPVHCACLLVWSLFSSHFRQSCSWDLVGASFDIPRRLDLSQSLVLWLLRSFGPSSARSLG